MSRIEIGRAGKKPVHIDLDILLRTRALVQANSGGGKSWLARRLAEQFFGKVPVWITDPEGEFNTLREDGKFDFFLVGKGGDTPADPRTAELVCHKLLELGASAVFDLYDLKPATRHHWMRVFLEALINAPKNLWRPLILMQDEAHTFAPEKGQGESEAFGAVQDVVTRGRKRGICSILFTQRLAKLSKNVSAELLNRLVGMTFEGIDVDRAAEVLSVPKSEREDFKIDLKSLEPGQFYGLGPAISRDRTLIQVGPVITPHREVGSKKFSTEPPPPSEKIKALLPKLKDLPQEAEQKAKTESELRAEIRSYRAQLAVRPKEEVVKTTVELVEVPIVKEIQIKRLEAAAQRLRDDATKVRATADEIISALAEAKGYQERIEARAGALRDPRPRPVQTNAQRTIAKVCNPVPANPKTRAAIAGMVERAAAAPPRDTTVSAPQLKILQAIATFEALGFSEVPRTWVAPLADTTHTSSGFEKNVGLLKKGGYLEIGGQHGTLRITSAGRGEVGNMEPPTHELLVQKCSAALSTPQGSLLSNLVQVYPQDLSFEELAERSGTTVTSSGFEKNRGILRTAGMAEYSAPGRARAAAWLFPDQVSA